MTIPNILTTIRIFLIPVMVVVYYLELPGEIVATSLNFFIMAVIFAVASLTDLADGYIARKYDMVTTYGKFMDPLADKILVISALLILVEVGLVPSWIVIIIVAREFMVTGLRMLLSEQGIVHSAGWSGKVKAAVTMVAIVFLFITPLQELGIIGIYIAAMLTLWSGMQYLLDVKEIFVTK